MNDRVVDIIILSSIVLGSFVVGLLIGGLFVHGVWRRILERTGQLKPVATEPTGAVHTRAPANTEVSAQRAITAASIERGAQDIIDRYKAAGHVITMKDARAEAAAMLGANDALGGVT